MTDYPITAQNRVRQVSRKASYDAEVVHGILDAGHIAQVGFVQDGAPLVVPMLYGREGDALFLHGARKARIVRLLERSPQVCANVTLLDGVVIARSMFHCSMNYRSVTVFGHPQLVTDREEKLHAMELIGEHLLPGRWSETRESHDREIRMTGVLRLPIESASAKVSEGMPRDEEEDYELPLWAGVLPLALRSGELQTDTAGVADLVPSAAMRALQNKAF